MATSPSPRNPPALCLECFDGCECMNPSCKPMKSGCMLSLAAQPHGIRIKSSCFSMSCSLHTGMTLGRHVCSMSHSDIWRSPIEPSQVSRLGSNTCRHQTHLQASLPDHIIHAITSPIYTVQASRLWHICCEGGCCHVHGTCCVVSASAWRQNLESAMRHI